ncbi:MAG: hypothetical protein JW779_14340 [Candidatus Thorarchaeota archaeon]|nr:hypothetical protein [Candidatus Thorarchaeota archaeon]
MKEFSNIAVPSKTSSVVKQAHQISFERGDVEGFSFIIQHKDTIHERFGPESKEYAFALNDHATYCQMRRIFSPGIESLIQETKIERATEHLEIAAKEMMVIYSNSTKYYID